VRAVVYERYGDPDVLEVREVADPTPKDDEVLIRVRATTVNRTDCGFRQGAPRFVRLLSGIGRPRRWPILGTELAGEVVDVGAAVTGLSVGDEVFGVNAPTFGAHAELVCVRESSPLALKPAGMSFEEAASVGDGMILADTCLAWVGVRAGQRIMVYGASGSIGTAAVQLARHLGAEVTAVCGSDGLEAVRSLGPDELLDYQQQEVVRPGETYDVVFDAVGKTSFGRWRSSLRRGGIYASTDFGPKGQNPFLSVLTWKLAPKRVMMPLPRYKQAHVRRLKELIEAGEYRAVIDRTYPLDQVVEATRYVESERKIGNVVLTT
jgi:NADPH:quinone reductase-like Zn-dependent oxidoreductase